MGGLNYLSKETSGGSEQVQTDSGRSFSETALLMWEGNKGYLNLWEVDKCPQDEHTPWARVRVLGMPYYHKEKFHVLLDMTLYEERKFNLARKLHDLLRECKGGCTKLVP